MSEHIRRIEELSLNAWPCLGQVVHDGWLLRFAGGYTGRANSVQALYDGSLDLDEKIQFCERQYGRRAMPTLFKLHGAVRPGQLDSELERRGYRTFNHTSVQVADLQGSVRPDEAGIVAHEAPTDEWVAAFARFRNLPDRQVDLLRGILGQIALPARFVAVVESGQTVACGMGVTEGSSVGVFDVATREDCRRRGHATAVVGAVLDWARGEGATRAYLQVMLDNGPATSLYARLGFREAYRYWYRSKRAT